MKNKKTIIGFLILIVFAACFASCKCGGQGDEYVFERDNIFVFIAHYKNSGQPVFYTKSKIYDQDWNIYNNVETSLDRVYLNFIKPSTDKKIPTPYLKDVFIYTWANKTLTP